MMPQNPIETRDKIISFLRIRGPSLPIPVAKHLVIDTIFASAFLSELASEKTIKISNLKVGGSPLYFLPGQEKMLENFSQYLGGKEKEAFLLLKEKLLLEDSKLEPAIRVALRSLKDFAFPLIVNLQEGQKIFWRYLALEEEEAKRRIEKILLPKIEKEEIKKVEEKIREIEKLAEIKEKIEKKPKSLEIEKPLIMIKEKARKEKVKDTTFLEKIKEFLILKDIELVQALDYSKKEVIAKIRINSDLGKLSFLLIAQDKKRVTEADLIKSHQKALNEKMPCYFLSYADLSGKIKTYLEDYGNLMKIDKL